MALLSLEFHSLTEVKTETRKMTQLSNFVPVTLSIVKNCPLQKPFEIEREQKSGRGGSCKWPQWFCGQKLEHLYHLELPTSKTFGICILRISRPHHSLARENRITLAAWEHLNQCNQCDLASFFKLALWEHAWEYRQKRKNMNLYRIDYQTIIPRQNCFLRESVLFGVSSLILIPRQSWSTHSKILWIYQIFAMICGAQIRWLW